jgi:SHS2 domain-containing protein
MDEPIRDPEVESELYVGVRALDHTADVGFEAGAATLESLFHRAAHGLMALLRGEDRRNDHGTEPEEDRRRAPYLTGEWHRIALEADDVESLLVAWLRELLWLYEARRFVYGAIRFETLTERSLVGRIGGMAETRVPAREIKGVTYHGLEVARDEGGWHARVILDV